MPAPLRNRNAQKPAADRASVIVTVRATPNETRRWTRNAKSLDLSLSRLCREAMNCYCLGKSLEAHPLAKKMQQTE